MESDHLEEAERFLRSALHQDADVGQVSRYDLESALYHVQKAREQRLTPQPHP
jgi:hypothetical protein